MRNNLLQTYLSKQPTDTPKERMAHAYALEGQSKLFLRVRHRNNAPTILSVIVDMSRVYYLKRIKNYITE